MTKSVATRADYDSCFISNVYQRSPKLVLGVATVVFLAGLVFLGVAIRDFVVLGTTRDAIGYLSGGIVGVIGGGLALLEIHRVSRWDRVGHFRTTSATLRGYKDHPINQDRSFVTALEKGVLVGVFDGHNTDGHGVAEHCKKRLPQYFQQAISRHHYSAKEAFIEAVELLQEEVRDMDGGCVMAASYIEYGTGKRTTAFLGDANITVFCKKGDKFKKKVLTDTVDWSHDSERERIGKANAEAGFNKFSLYDDVKVRLWVFNPKDNLYYPSANFSGAIGDFQSLASPVLQRVPTIHEDQAQEGELMIAMSDGIADFARYLASDVTQFWGKGVDLASVAVNSAWDELNHDDKTAVALFIPPASLQLPPAR